MRRGVIDTPGDVRIGNVTSPVGSNSQQARRVVTGADEDQAMAVDRARNDRVAVVTHAPDFLSRLWVVGIDSSARGADELFPAVHGDEQRRAEGKTAVSFHAAVGLPADLSRARFEGGNERLVAAVATEDQQVVHQDW